MPMRRDYRRRESCSSSEFSDYSDHSRSTAPTEHSVRPPLKQHEYPLSFSKPSYTWDYPSLDEFSDPRCSAETYASTVASDAEGEEEYPVFEEPPDCHYDNPAAFPSTPSEFAAYFPSTRRLHLRHDDTIDGNMNLRVDADVQLGHRERADLTLFHLRMHDLKNREFSLRRYCRDSGREVCHSSRKYTRPAVDRRPTLQRSVSNAIATLKSLSDNKRATRTSLKRTDSGYDSVSDDGADFDGDRAAPKAPESRPHSLPTNTTNIEFSNYAHLDLKRRGTKSSKRYEFEYWGNRYVWKRFAMREAASGDASYHLYCSNRVTPIAHIVPKSLTPAEVREEEEKGGWIPPSDMWLSDVDAKGLQDVAE